MTSAVLPPALPTRPLAIICLALGMLALPLHDHAAVWAIGVFLVSLAARLFINARALSLPPAWLKLLVLAACTGAILLNEGSLVNVESAFVILLILIGLKVCEANHARDLQVLTLLGCFLGLCDLFFEQDLGRWLYVGIGYAMVLTSRIYFFQPEQPRGFRRSLWQTFRILGQALPLTILLFLFFPRIYGDFRFIFNSSKSGATGLPEKLSPGSIAALALRTDTAFRVSFPDKNMPAAPLLYWRGLVLWDGAGLNWDRGGHSRREQKPTHLGGEAIRQHIMLKPYGDTWLFALDRPGSQILHALYESGDSLRRQRPFYTELMYDVTSYLENHELRLSPDDLAAATRRPTRISPAVQALAESWRADNASDAVIVERALDFFRNGGFSYSLSPGVYLSGEMDEFLFRRRTGFCEHYASAYASLVRLANIPSRVVLGYQGGEFNEIANYLIVRQSDAHAWCEVWLRGKGWVRVDPTSVIAPDRVNSGLQSYMDAGSQSGRTVASTSGAGKVWRNFEHTIRLYWDSLSYQWNLRVLGFDESSQITFLAVLGILDWNSLSRTSILVVSAGIIVAAVFTWIRRTPSGTKRDPARRWYARFCQRLARVGILRQPSEGPVDFANRAAELLPAHAPALRKIGSLYASLRYSAEPPPLREFVRAIRALPRLARPPAVKPPAALPS